MAMFVHLAAERDIPAIRRGGLRIGKGSPGVYAMPVLPNFVVSHQWLRELKLSGQRTLRAVYFRISDRERVLVGRYGKEQAAVTATQAAARIAAQSDPLGSQVIVPRAIRAKEIHRVRPLPQIIGWRYFPGAHGFFGDQVPLRPGAFGVNRRRERSAIRRAREMIEAASERLARAPRDIDALLDRGRSYETLGWIDKARADLTAALSIDPQDAYAAECLRRLDARPPQRKP
jgi:tetratricopeptide (TPR) repeat protein